MNEGGSNAGAATRRPWTEVHNWVYWLDGPDLAEIGTTAYELAVIDYAADGSADTEFTADEIAAVRRSGCARRVVSYLSIGEAEDYRFYWDEDWEPGDPSWLLEENPDWEGNYYVRYWDPAWQAVIYSYLDRIITAGFDGIYLDRIDAYTDEHAVGHEQDMVDFVLAVAEYARARSPLGADFGIIVQNAEELAADHPDYLAAATGIGREETYVFATDDPTSEAERAETEGYLDLFRQSSRGRLVLTIDYADDPDLIDEAYERAIAKGYVPYVADVDLDRLRLNAGHLPACTPVVSPRVRHVLALLSAW